MEGKKEEIRGVGRKVGEGKRERELMNPTKSEYLGYSGMPFQVLSCADEIFIC